MKRTVWSSVLLLGLFTTVAFAQVDLSPGVARISMIHGDVSTQRGDTGDWGAGALNQPVVAGDKVSTGDRSRVELQLDHSNILRLGNNAQANIATLTRTNIQVQVGQGLAYYSLFKDSDAEVEIDTPNVAVHPTSKEGVYRIEVSTGETRVTVRKGAADISTPQGSARVEKGQSAIVRGTADEAEYKLAGAPSKDEWDSWNNQRDNTIHNAQSWGRTNQYYVGSEDLDAYGHWVNVPDYGYVWQPVVAVGWAPYRVGRWVWEPYWGWTWVSYEPWGWAPYHYGRWFLYGGAWSWWPGPVYRAYRPIWAPAYVSFFGFGSHWGVSVGFGFGSVGWLPIGPSDRFYPWWGGYRSRFNVVNVTNITNITNVRGIEPLHSGNQFSNLRLAAANNEMMRRAISTVPAEHFGTGRTAPVPVSREAFRDGRMVAGNLPIVPTKEMASVSDRPVSGSLRGTSQQRFFTRQQPGAPQPFERQAAQVQEAIQRSGQAQMAGGGRASQTSDRAGVSVPANRTESQSGNTEARQGGWQRFGGQEAQSRAPEITNRRATPSPSPQAGRDAQSSQSRGNVSNDSGRYGWHKFDRSGAGQGQTTPSNPQADRGYRGSEGATPTPRPNNAPSPRNDGFQRFTPQANATPSERGGSRTTEDRSSRYTAGSDSTRSYAREDRSSGSSRPPLNMRQPIVTPRPSSESTYRGGGSSGGGNRSGGGGRSESRGSGGGGSHGSSGQSHSSSSSGGRSK